MFFCFGLSAKIVEVASFNELPGFLEKEMLVVLDIDNTILQTAQLLGSDQWFDHRMKEYQKSMSVEMAFEKTFAEWLAIESLTKVKLVEDVTGGLIKKLQQEGVTIMALTTRSSDLRFCTFRQFQSLGIDLSVTSPSHGDFFFLNRQPVLYRKGVLFTDGTNRGEALLKFLRKTHYSPKSILFINDKERQLKEVEEICKKMSIPFVGLRYSYLDRKVKEFDEKIARVQLEQIKSILSDEEAKEKLSQMR
jgi:hypothetical protein